MMGWNPGTYLKFANERTQPSRDLLSRIDKVSPARVLDLGCGPGNSTRLLVERWPAAKVVGVDNSPEMLERAREDLPEAEFVELDAGGDLSGLGKFDVVFSNAALQWIPGHDNLLPRLHALLSDSGALAVQIPNSWESDLHRTIRDTARSPKWRDRLQNERELHCLSPEDYYRLLSPLAGELSLWQTVYYHIMSSHADLLEWSRGTHLRPYLARLSGAEAEEFEAEILTAVRADYSPQHDGKILFPFNRLFFTVSKTTK